MTRTLPLLAVLFAACSHPAETEVQAAAQQAASAGQAQVPDPIVERTLEAPELPFLRDRRYLARSMEPEMLRAPADWRATPRGLPGYLVDRLAELDRAFDELMAGVELDRRYTSSRLYTSSMPDGLLVHWYLVQASTWHPGTFTVFVEDRATGRMTAEPVEYTSTWLSYGAPDPYFVDLDGDGAYEVRLQDLFHNGTSMNVYVDAFWEVGDELELTKVLAFAVEDDPLMRDGDMCGIQRRLRFPEEGGLALDVRQLRVGDTNESRDLGRQWLERDPASGMWGAGERLLLDPGDPWSTEVDLHGEVVLGWLDDGE